MLKYRIKRAFQRFLLLDVFQPVSDSGPMDSEHHRFRTPSGSSHWEGQQQQHRHETDGQDVPLTEERVTACGTVLPKASTSPSCSFQASPSTADTVGPLCSVGAVLCAANLERHHRLPP